MKKFKSLFIKISLPLLMILPVWWYVTPVAHATVSIFLPPVATSAASSTLSYITPATATATTTLPYDAYSTGQTFVTNTAALAVYDTASTTASVLRIYIQYSQDGKSWYADNMNNMAATTSAQIAVGVPVVYSFTPGANASSTAFIFPIATPTRYARALITSFGGNSGVYAQITPIRQLVQ